jgi:hypothetical protein
MIEALHLPLNTGKGKGDNLILSLSRKKRKTENLFFIKKTSYHWCFGGPRKLKPTC